MSRHAIGIRKLNKIKESCLTVRAQGFVEESDGESLETNQEEGRGARQC